MKKIKFLFTCLTTSAILVATTIVISSCGHKDPQIGANDVKGGVFKQAAEESNVLLKNGTENNPLLPLTRNSRIDLFGVTQINTFYGGGGSGDVYYPYHAINILDGIRHNPGLRVNEDLASYYEQAVSTGNYNNENDTYICNKELDIDNEGVWNMTDRNDVAIVVIGRRGREGRDLSDPTSQPNYNHFSLTDNTNKVGEMSELDLIEKVHANVPNTLVLFNTTSILDMKQFNDTGIFKDIPGLMYCWCGGQETGDGVASILAGDVSPSGKLVDTITKNGYSDYPSYGNFGDPTTTNHVEDIYVGYRYFETFAIDKVMYHFGYGLSYTKFKLEQIGGLEIKNGRINLSVKVTNIGNRYGKEVVQVYFQPPQSGLNKPDHQLVAYVKTDTLGPNNSQMINISFDVNEMASYNDAPNENRWQLDAGQYKIWYGTSANINDLTLATGDSYNPSSTTYITNSNEILKPIDPFNRVIGYRENGTPITEPTPTRQRNVINDVATNINSLPNNPYTGDRNIKLIDVYNNKKTMDQFVAQIQKHDLTDLVMTNWDGQGDIQFPGSSSVMGGVKQNLRNLGIPPIFAIDGPAGMKTFNKCYQAPMGTASACTFNDELVKKVFQVIGKDMQKNGAPVLLGPGLNIHRDPTGGRNFEYFSEDPLLTGMMACNVVEGVQSQGIMAVPKHFAVNNQEKNRFTINECVSERALNEINLKGFEIVTKQAKPFCMMTTYNQLNGGTGHTNYNHSNFELITTLLKKTWGWDGCILTDFGGSYDQGDNPDLVYNGKSAKRYAGMIRAGGSVYQNLDSAYTNQDDPSQNKPAGWRSQEVLNALDEGQLTLQELQSSAKEILNMIMHSCVFLKAHGLDTFGKNYSKSLINIPESFKISKSVHRHINVTNIHIGDALLANFDSDSMTYSLINCNYLDKNFSKIKVDTNAKHVTAQHTQLDNGEKVVTITLANDDGDMKKIHLYSTNQPNQCVLNDIALSSSPTSIYINGNKYLGYFKNRFEYDVYVPDVNDVNFSVDTTNSTKVEIIRNNDVVTLKCINQYQTLFYYFNLHQGQDDMVTTNIGFNDTAILTANTSVFQYKQTKMLDDNYGSYIGDTQIDGFSAFSINVQKSGYYNLTASISESQADRTFDQLKGNGEFELRTGQSLNDGNSFKWRVRAQPVPQFITLDAQKVYLNKGYQKIFFYTDTQKIINLQSIIIYH